MKTATRFLNCALTLTAVLGLSGMAAADEVAVSSGQCTAAQQESLYQQVVEQTVKACAAAWDAEEASGDTPYKCVSRSDVALVGAALSKARADQDQAASAASAADLANRALQGCPPGDYTRASAEEYAIALRARSRIAAVIAHLNEKLANARAQSRSDGAGFEGFAVTLAQLVKALGH